MNDDSSSWRLTFTQSCWAALVIGLLIFISVWSGFDSREPDLFSPRPLREIWGVLPGAVAFSFAAIQMARLLDRVKDLRWPYWIAYIVALITVVTVGVWLVVHFVAA